MHEMSNLKQLDRLARYVSDVFYEPTGLIPWASARNLPIFLQSGFSYVEVTLLDKTCLLVIDQHADEHKTAVNIKKYFKTINQHYLGHLIYSVEEIASYNRKRLIDQRIAFIVPGKQLYLPFFATDLRESFKVLKKREESKLGAIAQQLLFLYLYKKLESGVSAQTLAKQLHVSKMSISRAYAELEACQLANTKSVGRQKVLLFYFQGRELWEAAKPSLTSPVRKRVWVNQTDFFNQNHLPVEAGETALAHLGTIIPPKQSVYAVNYKDWSTMQIEEIPAPYDGTIMVELWRYDPAILATENKADPLSLYMSLSDVQDDRVDIAKDELLKITLE
jgi:DNA-binding MarR family transcriptional regulator